MRAVHTSREKGLAERQELHKQRQEVEARHPALVTVTLRGSQIQTRATSSSNGKPPLPPDPSTMNRTMSTDSNDSRSDSLPPPPPPPWTGAIGFEVIKAAQHHHSHRRRDSDASDGGEYGAQAQAKALARVAVLSDSADEVLGGPNAIHFAKTESELASSRTTLDRRLSSGGMSDGAGTSVSDVDTASSYTSDSELSDGGKVDPHQAETLKAIEALQDDQSASEDSDRPPEDGDGDLLDIPSSPTSPDAASTPRSTGAGSRRMVPDNQSPVRSARKVIKPLG